MKMDEVKISNAVRQGSFHGGRPVDPAQMMARKVPDLDAIEINRPLERNRTVIRTVDISCENMNLETYSDQALAKSMDGENRPAITEGGMVCRGYVEQTHNRALSPDRGVNRGQRPFYGSIDGIVTHNALLCRLPHRA